MLKEIELEKELLEKIRTILEENIISLQEPANMFFVSWSGLNPEGRMTSVWQLKNNILVEDSRKLKILNIWSLIFPELREDYLVERMWDQMVTNNNSSDSPSSLIIHSCTECKDPIGEYEYHIEKEFILSLKGTEISRIIENSPGFDFDPIDKDKILKIARILKYDRDFKLLQSMSIDEGFSNWVREKNNPSGSLNSLFEKFYGKNDPTRNPLDARKFLTMWQNFSVLFPDYCYSLMSFDISDSNDPLRYAVVLFYNKNTHLNFAQIKIELNRCMERINRLVSRSIIDFYKSIPNYKDPIHDSPWLRTKNASEDLWIKLVGEKRKDDYDILMEIACNLALSRHETHPSRFAFIAGTEGIWPSIGEIISYLPNALQLLNEPKEIVELNSKFCESNYSILQIEGVVEFFHINNQQISKIIRLRQPDREELTMLQDPISDWDDLYCWTLERIYHKTKGFERSLIIATTGTGKILIYGLNEKTGWADLLLIWDIFSGKLNEPINLKNFIEIDRALVKFNLANDSIKYRRLLKTIRKISANSGEGACLILSSNETRIQKYLRSIEPIPPSWIETLGLDDPLYVLKAAFIMDGACLLTPSDIKTRLTIYPHLNDEAYGYKNVFEARAGEINNNFIINKLTGKGSKTHGSSNLSTLPELNKSLKDPEVVVISISSDGPIKVWPYELLT
jgi:hypothetical protein